jgi:hypothetical protein
MDLGLVEKSVSELDPDSGPDLIFDLLAAYGSPKASLSRLRRGSLNKASRQGDVLWRNKVFFRHLSDGEDPHLAIDAMASDGQVLKEKPRFLVVTTGTELLAVDTKTGDALDTPLERLRLSVAFFMPWAGFEKAQLEAAHYADIKAAEQMARLHDEIRTANSVETEEEAHTVNVFFVRLLFCLFAEDTGVLERGALTSSVASLTRPDGSDLGAFLARFFVVLDTPEGKRVDLPDHLAGLGYVNGALFAEESPVPEMTARARSILIECGELDWSEITPDIFGSMMQAVVRRDTRAEAGMHYTSVENILKVLRPLFLDSLEDELDSAGSDERKLERLLNRIATIRVFDPAAGSGNFLVVAYRELRLLEMRVLEQLASLRQESLGASMFDTSRVELDHFFGIELDDFAHEVIRLSLWIAKHQINKRFAERFGAFPPLIPLSGAGSVAQGNAIALDWEEVCPPALQLTGTETYVCGNPPYVGSSMQAASQKKDLADYFGDEPFSPNLDYVSAWLLKAADYCAATGAVAGFVTTNSIAQGDHVALLFPKIFARGVEIAFAHQSFLWTNNARGRAGVTCVVVGLARPSGRKKNLTSADGSRLVDHIGPYLIPSKHDTVVRRASASAWGLPPILRGSQPTDGGHLILNRREKGDLVAAYPQAARYLRRYLGSEEHHNGTERWCLWIPDDEAAAAAQIPPVAERFRAVTEMRLRGSPTAQARAHEPHRFMQRPHRDTAALIIPRVSAERRDYVPIGFVGADTVISDAANAVYGAEAWLFGLVQSRMHMAWLRAVGGRMRTDYRYSGVLVYNTFPIPPFAAEAKADISEAALAVLSAREAYPERSLAELYDPEKMPRGLCAAHGTLDAEVDGLYSARGFASDDDRVAHLFERYREVHGDGGVGDA